MKETEAGDTAMIYIVLPVFNRSEFEEPMSTRLD